MHISKRGFRGLVTIAATGALVAGLSACSGGAEAGSTGDAAGSDVITVGFVAVGPEGGWRNANEQAIKDAFTKDAGFDLKYAPAASPSDQKTGTSVKARNPSRFGVRKPRAASVSFWLLLLMVGARRRRGVFDATARLTSSQRRPPPFIAF